MRRVKKIKFKVDQPLIDLNKLHQDIIDKKIEASILPGQREAAKKLVASFHGKEVYSWGEDEKRPRFLDTLFCDILGYKKTDSLERNGEHVSFATEFTDNLKTRPDGILGYFSINALNQHDTKDIYPDAFIEVENAKYSFGAQKSDKDKGVDQAFEYAARFTNPHNHQRLKIVTNFVELRIYTDNKIESHSIDLTQLDKGDRLAQLFYFLSPKNLIPELRKTETHDSPFVKLKKAIQHDKARGLQISADRATDMGEIHTKLIDLGFYRNQADKTIVRLAFLMFADDTGIINGENTFTNFLEHLLSVDPADRILHLVRLFTAVDTQDKDERNRLAPGFPYIDGGLFRGADSDMGSLISKRALDDNIIKRLYDISCQDWSRINPIVFGSMYEGAMKKKVRHDIGAHYTSEASILKVINGLFMNQLRSEFESYRNSNNSTVTKLLAFKRYLSSLTFLDPACGSGNFLIVAYRELRRLEHEVINEILDLTDQRQRLNMGFGVTDLSAEYGFNSRGTLVTKEHARSLKTWQPLIGVEVSQFSGIEIGIPYKDASGKQQYNGYPINIAKAGMWMMDHLMNREFSDMVGGVPFIRIPLHESANIIQANALRTDWSDATQVKSLSYILGNPPFIGARNMSTDQKDDLHIIAPRGLKVDSLDYVAGWYIKAAKIISINPYVQVAFVSTNSITQGVQPKILFQYLFKQKTCISFAHQTFNWDNNGAHVHVVIVGFLKKSLFKALNLKHVLYEYPDGINGQAKLTLADNINGYLRKQRNYNLPKQNNQISGYPNMLYGSQFLDRNYLYLTDEEEQTLYKQTPEAKQQHWVRFVVGGKEIALCHPRKALYLNNIDESKLKKIPLLKEKAALVTKARKAMADDKREKGKLKEAAKYDNLAAHPYYLATDHVDGKPNIMIPRVSSGTRDYMPVIITNDLTIANDQAFQLPDTDLFLFGILSSKMNMAWLRQFGGRLKSDYRYSNKLVYNTFPFPQANEDQKNVVRKAVKNVLDIRNKYFLQHKNLRKLYNKKCMPPDLLNAHQQIDELIDKMYRDQPFHNDQERIDFLYDLVYN